MASEVAGYSSDSNHDQHPAEALILDKARKRDRQESQAGASTPMAGSSQNNDQSSQENGNVEHPPGLYNLHQGQQAAANNTGEFTIGKALVRKRRRRRRHGARVVEMTTKTVIEGVDDAVLAVEQKVSTAVRTEDADIDTVSLLSSDSEEERGITLGNAPDAPATSRPSQAAPIGVTVVPEGEELVARAPEMQRLLRQPRYFDEDFEAAAMRCFKCGGQGHMARDCPNEERQRPCHLCGQFGHNRSQCSNMICFKCNKPGHLARDCTAGYAAAQVCLRCGQENCPAAGAPDYFRAEGGCTGEYWEDDLRQARCQACGRCGHLCCQAAEDLPPQKPSCYNCGEGGHVAEECWRERPQAVQNERRGFASRRMTAMPRGDHTYYTAAAFTRTSWDIYGGEDTRSGNGYGGQRVGNTYGGFAGNGYGQRGYGGASSTAERVSRFARSTRMDDASFDQDQPQKSRTQWKEGENRDWRKYGATRKSR